jgi:hypothetical protein
MSLSSLLPPGASRFEPTAPPGRPTVGRALSQFEELDITEPIVGQLRFVAAADGERHHGYISIHARYACSNP